MLFGSFIEHIGECIHNGIWTYDRSKLPLTDHPDLDRVRRDLLQAISGLRPALLRWPGGCYADVYHWKDAVGPRETRKSVRNKFWENWGTQLFKGISSTSLRHIDDGQTEAFPKRVGHDVHNQFGTGEFLALCEEIDALPYITVNYGSGTPQEAADWVEYCNGPSHSNYGALRAIHGRKVPFNVPIWGIGNEIYLENEQGYEKDPACYARQYMLFARAMKEKDPSIKLVGCGWNQAGWNDGFLKEVEDGYIHYLSLHQYLPFPTNLNQLLEMDHPDQESVYWAMMAAPFEIKKQILKAWNSIVRRFGENSQVKVAFDEWGIWYTIHDMIKANYNLQDGLFAALVLILFQQFSNICPIGLWSMLVNSLGMIRTDEQGLILTPVYHVFKLFKDHTYFNLVENVSVTSELFNVVGFGQIGNIQGTPLIECAVTRSEDGSRLSIMFVNKHISDDVVVQLQIKAFAFFRMGELVELTSHSPFDYNTKEDRTKIEIREVDISHVTPEMSLDLKPHSITILKLLKLDLGISI